MPNASTIGAMQGNEPAILQQLVKDSVWICGFVGPINSKLRVSYSISSDS
jgi:hypothetical protein